MCIKIIEGSYAGMSGTVLEQDADGDFEVMVEVAGQKVEVQVFASDALREPANPREALRKLIHDDCDRQGIGQYFGWWSAKLDVSESELLAEAVNYRQFRKLEGDRREAWLAATLAAFDEAFPTATPDIVDRFDIDLERWLPGAVALAIAEMRAGKDAEYRAARMAIRQIANRAHAAWSASRPDSDSEPA